jgi:hypothetical protein
MTRTLAFFALLYTALSGSAAAKSVNPKHLKTVEPAVAYRLDAEVSAEGYNITYTVKPGNYLLRYRDSHGVYLLGEDQCLHVHIHSPKSEGHNDYECGLYLPDDTGKGASFYRIRPAAGHQPAMGPVVNWMIAYGTGSFDWFDYVESQTLRAGLVPATEANVADSTDPAETK